ncbi:MAG: biopolymer transporter ExbD [Campylobacterales bacterium]|nr:biopolymer transporter ExbD [Campylobacterales bacterium]
MSRRREPITPDITPLIDVVFILLIFFIVSSVFKKEELALTLNLPNSNAQTLEVEQKQINIELSSKQLAINGKVVTFLQFNNEIQKIEKKDKPIIVRIDKDVPYERVVHVLDILQKFSLNNLALVTTP